ncbi:MarR family winged helix-turn-helix transcriptional regulator [Streptomyces beijiangensis]|uniref:MarR family transcriptional regulator n=1 Tax=Streptomyces beijiangensis TaxID=163361 RepID=A0A939JFH6_9ACTN|nr:MarR family transcriptional regulator [Streptomyces beijiangensis]MBO0510527.1 MarR family transcriptional regulator [Streptomyces beijiangensis]
MTTDSSAPDAGQVAAELTVVLGRVARRLRSASPDNLLTPSQRSVLSRLDRGGPATTAELARLELVRPQSMRLTVGALEEHGLVERTPDPSDGRQVVVSVTGQGRRVLADVRAEKQGWLTGAIQEELDAGELRTLSEAVELLERLVQR